MTAVSWCSQLAMVAASSAPHIQAMITRDIRRGGGAGRCCACCHGMFSTVVRCRYQCSAATALPGSDTSRFVTMNEQASIASAFASSGNGRAY